MSKIKGGYCYLCGAYRNTLTRDHIPPKNLAPKTPNSVFLYAPACSACNNKLSHDESKFRDFLAVTSADKNNPEAFDAFEAFERNIQRNDLGRAGMPHKDLTRILQGMGKKNVYTPGSIYLGTITTLTPASDINIQGILLKIARGLQMVHTGEIIPDSYARAARLYSHSSPLPPLEGIDKAPVIGNVGNFFHYRGGWASDDAKTCMWYMMFYRRIVGVAIFGQPRPEEVLGSSASVETDEGTVNV